MSRPAPPRPVNVLAYSAIASVAYGYLLFFSGPDQFTKFLAFFLWAAGMQVANVALNWQEWSQPMRLPTRDEWRSLKPPKAIDCLTCAVFALWLGAAAAFVAALPGDVLRPDVLASNKPLFMCLWGASLLMPIRRLVKESSEGQKAEPGVGADSR